MDASGVSDHAIAPVTADVHPKTKDTPSTEPVSRCNTTSPAADDSDGASTATPATDSQTRSLRDHAGWLRDRDQVTLAALLAVALSLLTWRAYRLATYQPDQFVIEKATDGIGYRIDLNTAAWLELSQLEGVGPVLAKRIVRERDRNGPFTSVDDLQRVTGIGPRTVERNRPWMQVTESFRR
ncbi:MAG: ComEA family DNA-binding protein [Planctomycetota bacterium]|jgi:competence protein ComEA